MNTQAQASLTSKTALQLFRDDFDGLENHPSAALSTKMIGLFLDEPHKTANQKIHEFLKKLGPVEIYRGWDGEFYPRFYTKKVLAT